MTGHKLKIKRFLVLLTLLLSLPVASLHAQSKSSGATKLSTAKRYYSNGKFQKALPYLNAVLQENPHHETALVLRARTFLVLGYIEKAKKDANQILDHTKSAWKGHLLLGKIELHLGNRKESLKHLNRTLTRDRNVPEARKLRGLIHWRERRYAKAKQDFDRIKLGGLQNPTLFIAMSQTYYCTNNINRALRIAKAGLTKKPGDRELKRIVDFSNQNVPPEVEQKIEHAEAVYRDNSDTNAPDIITQLIKKHPNLARLYTIRGNFHFGLKQYEAAEQDARKARKLDPHLAEAPFLLGNIYMKRKNYRKAAHWLDISRSLNKHDTRNTALLGICRVKTDAYKDAILLLDSLQDRIYNHPEALRALARAYLKENLLIPAQRLLDRATRNDRDTNRLRKQVERKLSDRAEEEKGTFRNETYRNNKIGFKISLPDQWTYTDTAYSGLLKAVFLSPQLGDRVMVTSRLIPPHYRDLDPEKQTDRKKLRSLVIKDLHERNPGFEFTGDSTWKPGDRSGYRALFKKPTQPSGNLTMHLFMMYHKNRMVTIHYVSERKPKKIRPTLRKFMETFDIMK